MPRVADLITIGQLARSAGVAVSAVRFYERAGLIAPRRRTGSNYRQYDGSALRRLRFLKDAQAGGFRLADVRAMLAMADDDGDGSPCAEVAALIGRRLAEVRARLRELRRVERALSVAGAACCGGSPDWCREIDRLKGAGVGHA